MGGLLRHLRKVLRAVLTTTLHSSFHHGLHWASLLGEEGWLSLKHLMLAASMHVECCRNLRGVRLGMKIIVLE